MGFEFLLIPEISPIPSARRGHNMYSNHDLSVINMAMMIPFDKDDD